MQIKKGWLAPALPEGNRRYNDLGGELYLRYYIVGIDDELLYTGFSRRPAGAGGLDAF
jgi:hypothetical protein